MMELGIVGTGVLQLWMLALARGDDDVTDDDTQSNVTDDDVVSTALDVTDLVNKPNHCWVT